MNYNTNPIIVDDIKYIKIFYNYDYKKTSFNTEVYYTLIDICDNITNYNIFHFAWKYLHILCNDKRTYKLDELTFSSMLESEYYIENILSILKWIIQDDFKFKKIENMNNKNMNAYIKFDDWLTDFEKLKDKLELKLYDITNSK